MNRGFNVLTPLAPEDLVFCALTGDEELSRPFDFHLELRSPRPDLDFNALIGQSFTVEIDLPLGGTRYLNGQCVHFAATGKSGRWYHYEARLRPWLWYATRRSDCKIFQHQSVPQIVKEVLSRYPYPIQDKLSAQYREWDYCVQYRESDFQFVSRLMEHEGIYYYFEHSEGEHTLVLCDDIGAHAPFPDYATIPFNGPESSLMEEERLESWQIGHSVDSGTFVAQAYDFEKPFADLTTMRAIDRAHAQASHEVFDYPGDYTHPDDGEHYARMRIQEMHCEHEVALATGPVRGAAPGHLFTLAYHSREDQNREYLITQVIYSLTANSYEAGGGEGSESYQASIKVLPTTETYRPHRETPKPRTMGPETALVVGPKGEEIYTDQYGRVKVQFPWDRYGKKNENSSCWIRVASSWAGTGFGMVQIPRIGQEVIVDYLGGDPDRPMITGSVYNAEQMPPWRLPGSMTQSGILSRSLDKSDRECANALRFEDKKGEEELWLHAERDQRIEVENDESHSVGHDRTKTVGNDETTEIKRHRTETVDGNETITIHQNRSERVDQNESVSIGGHRVETVTLTKAETIGLAKALTIGGAYQTSVGAAMNTTVALAQAEEIGLSKTTVVGKKYSVSAGDELEITVGKASLVMKSDGTILINGSQFNFEASGPVQITGKDIDLN